MNIQRLKFAWARGARIQYNSGYKVDETGRDVYGGDGWSYVAGVNHAEGREHLFRIHPDDAHLEYGPVSTALRDMALYTDSIELDEITEMFREFAGPDYWMGTAFVVESDMARLFFAEMLADEGL